MLDKIQYTRYWLYIKIIRPALSPILFYIIYWFKYRKHKNLFKEWKRTRNLTVSQFSNTLNAYPYRRQNRVFDFSPRRKDFFFLEYTDDRDCGHFARMWYWYFKFHGIPCKEIAIIFGNGEGHLITVAKIKSEWKLYDYTPISSGNSKINKLINEHYFNCRFWFEYKEMFLD